MKSDSRLTVQLIDTSKLNFKAKGALLCIKYDNGYDKEAGYLYPPVKVGRLTMGVSRLCDVNYYQPVTLFVGGIEVVESALEGYIEEWNKIKHRAEVYMSLKKSKS